MSGVKISIGTYTFDPDVTRRELAFMIILHEYPLAIVEHEGFKRFCNFLQLLFKSLSKNTTKSHILKIFEIERSKQMKLLEKNSSRVAITTDMWTVNN